MSMGSNQMVYVPSEMSPTHQVGMQTLKRLSAQRLPSLK
jgi:hypothetical protein